MLAEIPANRFAEAEEVANAAAFLCSLTVGSMELMCLLMVEELGVFDFLNEKMSNRILMTLMGLLIFNVILGQETEKYSKLIKKGSAFYQNK